MTTCLRLLMIVTVYVQHCEPARMKCTTWRDCQIGYCCVNNTTIGIGINTPVERYCERIGGLGNVCLVPNQGKSLNQVFNEYCPCKKSMKCINSGLMVISPRVYGRCGSSIPDMTSGSMPAVMPTSHLLVRSCITSKDCNIGECCVKSTKTNKITAIDSTIKQCTPLGAISHMCLVNQNGLEVTDSSEFKDICPCSSGHTCIGTQGDRGKCSIFVNAHNSTVQIVHKWRKTYTILAISWTLSFIVYLAVMFFHKPSLNFKQYATDMINKLDSNESANKFIQNPSFLPSTFTNPSFQINEKQFATKEDCTVSHKWSGHNGHLKKNCDIRNINGYCINKHQQHCHPSGYFEHDRTRTTHSDSRPKSDASFCDYKNAGSHGHHVHGPVLERNTSINLKQYSKYISQELEHNRKTPYLDALGNILVASNEDFDDDMMMMHAHRPKQCFCISDGLLHSKQLNDLSTLSNIINPRIRNNSEIAILSQEHTVTRSPCLKYIIKDRRKGDTVFNKYQATLFQNSDGLRGCATSAKLYVSVVNKS